MKPPGSPSELRIAGDGCRVRHDTSAARYFIGLHACHETATIYGALVRTWGRGLLATSDVIAGSRCRSSRIAVALEGEAASRHAAGGPAGYRRPGTELAELATEAAAALISRAGVEIDALRSIGLLDFGHWGLDPLGARSFVSHCDTALLAKLTGMTVVDDFPARDLAHGGRGGPCEAVGAWLLLADRGIMPGRRIRALVDLDRTTRLFLLPPRQSIQLPPQLNCYELGPGLSLLDGIMRQLGDRPFEAKENLGVQGRRFPDLIDQWRHSLDQSPVGWSPQGADAGPLLRTVADWPTPLTTRLADVLCSAVHLIADQIGNCVQHRLPRSLPVGQLILAGPASSHAFLMHQIKQNIPEIEVNTIDSQIVSTNSWRAVAAALLGMLHVDQVAGNTPTLTGAETPRTLGRITPGSPGNWHRVLADMALTLPDKMTLRSAV